MIKKLVPGFLNLLKLFFLSLLMASCHTGGNEENTPTVKMKLRNDYEGTGQNKILDVTVVLSSPATVPVTVTYSTVDSTAKGGMDFIPITHGTLVFNPGETSKKINIELVSDSIMEFTESFKLMITNVENAKLAGPILSITIYDDDLTRPTLLEDGYITPKSYPGMKLRFADEFNDSIINYFTWNYETGEGPWGVGQLQEFTDKSENLSVKNGKLRITAINNNGHFTSGRINTVNTNSVHFGVIDIRAKLPSGRGIFPSIWLLNTDYNGSNWPKCGEIDIAALNGNIPSQIIGIAYYSASGPRNKEGFYSLPDYTNSFSDQFHIFTIIWQNDRIEWFVDYKKYMEIVQDDVGNDWPFNSSFYFYLDLVVGGTLVGDPDNTTVFPQTMEVDYIRAFFPNE